MELIKSFIDFVLHLDKNLPLLVSQYDNWTYLILALIIFCETGLVVTPILPGDSLLFAAGTVAATGSLNIVLLMAILFVAAFAGDNLNYFIGKKIGPKAFDGNFKFFKKEYLIKTHNFFEKNGGKTIIIARFVPIVRTFAPFVAGIGTMNYSRFISFCIIGNLLWILSLTSAGYFLGQTELVRNNFSVVIFMIIAISLMPPVIAFLKTRFQKA